MHPNTSSDLAAGRNNGPRVLLVNDTSTSPNWGCRGTTLALRNMIEQAGARITSAIFLHDMFVKEALVLDCGDKIKDALPTVASDFHRIARYVACGTAFQGEMEKIYNCDIVVINGEGSIYDVQRKGVYALWIAYIAKKIAKKNVMLVNFTAEIHDKRMLEIAALTFPLCDDIVFREPLSAHHCSELLPDFPFSIAADAAFTFSPKPRDEWLRVAGRPGYFATWPHADNGFDPSQPYIMLAGSSIYFRTDRPKYNPLFAYAKITERFLREGVQVVGFAPCSKDEELIKAICTSFSLPYIALNTATVQAVDLLGNASAVVSGRWHPSIFAATGGTPIVALTANTHKTSGLLRQLDLGESAIDALNLHQHVDNVCDKTLGYLTQGAALRKKIKSNAHRLAELATLNVRHLHRLRACDSPRPKTRTDVVRLAGREVPTNWWNVIAKEGLRFAIADRKPDKLGVEESIYKDIRRLTDQDSIVVLDALVHALSKKPLDPTTVLDNEQINDRSFTILILIASGLFQLEEYVQAETFFLHAVKTRKGSRAARKGLAMVAEKTGDSAAAATWWKSYVDITSGLDNYITQAGLHALRVRDHELVITVLRRHVDARVESRNFVRSARHVLASEISKALEPEKRADLMKLALEASHIFPPRLTIHQSYLKLSRNEIPPESQQLVKSETAPQAFFICNYDSSLKCAKLLSSYFTKQGWNSAIFVVLSDTEILKAGINAGDIADGVDHGTIEDFFLRHDISSLTCIHVGVAGPLINDFIARLDTVAERANTNQRPLTFGGFMGIACIGLLSGVYFRRNLDFVYLNCQRDFDEIMAAFEWAPQNNQFAITGLVPLDLAVRSKHEAAPRSNSVLFACQPTLPSSRQAREILVRKLVEWGHAQPEKRILIKPRTRPGERSLLQENFHFADVFEDLKAKGIYAPNVSITYTPIDQLVSRIGLLVTISSTAAYEALVAGARVAFIDDFGVRENYGNTYFLQSKLITSLDTLIKGSVPKIDEKWRKRNIIEDGRCVERVFREVQKRVAMRQVR